MGFFCTVKGGEDAKRTFLRTNHSPFLPSHLTVALALPPFLYCTKKNPFSASATVGREGRKSGTSFLTIPQNAFDMSRSQKKRAYSCGCALFFGGGSLPRPECFSEVALNRHDYLLPTYSPTREATRSRYCQSRLKCTRSCLKCTPGKWGANVVFGGEG